MRLRSIRVAAIHELPLQCVFLHQSYKAHLQTEMVLPIFLIIRGHGALGKQGMGH
ncbi:MAG: hypothetical protein RMY29_026135 [Nostoc sp. CreGUA01]|nr:hypothetical protein [Nostoc sp. CreGUA01]